MMIGTMQGNSSLHASLTCIAQRIFPDAVLRRHWMLSGGVSAAIHALEVELPGGGEQRLVVRQPSAAGGEAATPEQATREFELLQALHAIGLPVPEPYLADSSGEIFPAPCVVMAFVEGTLTVQPEMLPDALQQMAGFLARLHHLDVTQLELPELPSRDEPIHEMLAFLPDGVPESWREALQAIGSVRTTNARGLLHGDFWPGNVLWSGGRLVGVIDWEDSALGEPLSDLALTRLELLWKHGATASEEFTGYYLASSPISIEHLPFWDLYVATAARTFMPTWRLPAEVERRQQSLATEFSERAARQILAR